MSNKRPAYIEIDNIGTLPIQLYGWNGAPVRLSCDSNGKLTVDGLDIPSHDEIDISYSSGNPEVILFKNSSVTVATLNLTYSSGSVVNIIKS